MYYTKAISAMYYNDEMADLILTMTLAWQKAKREGSVERKEKLRLAEITNRKLFHTFFFGLGLAGLDYMWPPIIKYLIEKYYFKQVDAEFVSAVHN